MDKFLSILGQLGQYWWVSVPIFMILAYKWILRVLFGMIIIPEDKIGLVTKKFVLFGENKSLPDGRIIALNGEAGYQADTLAPGLYWGYWVWQFSIDLQDFIKIPQSRIGLIVAKDGSELPAGSILGKGIDCDNFQNARAFLNGGGQKGKQVYYINTGVYRINTFLFEVATTDITVIEEGQVGVITALDGVPLESGQIAGKAVVDHNNFQAFDMFLKNGGQRGLQTQIILAGSYALNPWAIQVEKVAMTEIPISNVGVVISYVGDEGVDVSGTEFKHGNIVHKGQKGVWSTPLDPGKYPINPYTTKIQVVPTANLVLNWANARTESHNLDKNLSTITVRSKDGFQFNLDVSQIIHIPSTEAPKVIGRFGSVQNLVSQVLEPTIGNYFRNSAQGEDVISFLTNRQERQNAAKARIAEVLNEYNVHAVDTLIGDITPPGDLMKTLTDRKIAQEEEKTYETQMQAQKVKQTLEKETALANKQKEIVDAQQSVQIAERRAEASVKESEGKAQSLKLAAAAESEAIKLRAQGEAQSVKLAAGAESEAIKLRADAVAFETEQVGKAEATKIEGIGNATAEAYRKQVEAMGSDNFSKFKITEEIGKNKIKIIPEVLISGGSSGSDGPISGLLGLELLKQIQLKNESPVTKTKTEVKGETGEVK
jgi:uncharacterized membrane protein YqiK